MAQKGPKKAKQVKRKSAETKKKSSYAQKTVKPSQTAQKAQKKVVSQGTQKAQKKVVSHSLRSSSEFTSEECDAWKKNKTVNPKTGRKISEGKGVYNKLEKQCKSFSKTDAEMCKTSPTLPRKGNYPSLKLRNFVDKVFVNDNLPHREQMVDYYTTKLYEILQNLYKDMKDGNVDEDLEFSWILA